MSVILCGVWVLYTVWLGFVLRTLVQESAPAASGAASQGSSSSAAAAQNRGQIVRVAFCVALWFLVACQSIFVLWFYAGRFNQQELAVRWLVGWLVGWWVGW